MNLNIYNKFNRERHSLPPEVYIACDEKNAGDAAKVRHQHEDTVRGICEEAGIRFILQPVHPARRDADNKRMENNDG